MPELNRYDVEITLVQKGIQAEDGRDAIAVMMSNVRIKGYVKTKALYVEKVNP